MQFGYHPSSTSPVAQKIRAAVLERSRAAATPAPLPPSEADDVLPEMAALVALADQYRDSPELALRGRQIILLLLSSKYGRERAAAAMRTIPEAVDGARRVLCGTVAAGVLAIDPTPESFTTLFAAHVGNPEQFRHTRRDIVKMTAEAFKLSVADLRSARRTRDLVRPRHIAMFLCKQFTPGSYPEIGRAMGNRDHTTALFACRKMQAIVDAKGIDFGPDIRAWIKGFADMAGRGELTA